MQSTPVRTKFSLEELQSINNSEWFPLTGVKFSDGQTIQLCNVVWQHNSHGSFFAKGEQICFIDLEYLNSDIAKMDLVSLLDPLAWYPPD